MNANIIYKLGFVEDMFIPRQLEIPSNLSLSLSLSLIFLCPLLSVDEGAIYTPRPSLQ